MRVLAYEGGHGVYAEAMWSVLRGLRPGAEVAACGIAELGAGVEGFDPDLLVSSRPDAVNPRWRAAWCVLSAESDEPSEVCVEGGAGA